MSKILNNLFLGSYHDAKDQTFLHTSQITHIVTVGAELRIHYPDSYKYLYIPAHDTVKYQLCDYFDDVADFIHTAIETEKGNVFVHCKKGVSRSTSSVMAYLIKYHGLNCSEARGFVKARREEIFPNPGFMRQLNAYAESFVKILVEEEDKEKTITPRKSTYRSKSLGKGSENCQDTEKAGSQGFVSKYAGIVSFCRNYEKKAVVPNVGEVGGEIGVECDKAIYVASVP